MEDADRVIYRGARKARPPRLISCVSVRYEPYGVFVAPPEPLPPVCPAGTLTLMSVLLRRVRPPPNTNQPITSSRMTTTTAQTAPELPPRDSPLDGVC